MVSQSARHPWGSGPPGALWKRGFVLDPGKGQLPATAWFALGVAFYMQTLRAQSKLFVKPRTKRLVNILGELLQVWMDNRLTPSQAARLFGKLDFLNQTLFGKVGRTGLLPIKKRQYDASGNHGLTFELKAAISWLVELLVTCPPREISLHEASKPPLLLYTDGSSNPNRDTVHVVGAVLFIPGQEKPLYTACPVPDEVISQWVPAKQQIHLVELLLAQWPWTLSFGIPF